MHYLLDTTETIAPGLGFAPFGPLHLGWLAAGVVFVLLSAVGYRRWKEPARRRWRNGVAWLIVADELLKMAVLFAGGSWLPKYLPLHLCSINIFIVLWYALRPRGWVGNYLYLVCLPAAVAALLMPTWVTLPGLALMNIHSFTIHILLAAFPLVLVLAGEIRPRWANCPRILALLGLLAAVAVGANLLLDTNFMFLMNPDVVGLLIWFEEHWGSHLYGLAAIMAVLLVVMNIPTMVLDAKEKKEGTRG